MDKWDWDELYEKAEKLPQSAGVRSDSVRYSVLGLLGEGSRKKVYRVIDHLSGREIARASLKNSGSPDEREVFLREARIGALLQHPNIMPVYDLDPDALEPWFTMKLAGTSLLKFLQSKPPLSEKLDLFSKICEAIAYAHSRGVLHLDLKPENIQVSQFGEVLVCDWGEAILRVNTQESILLDDERLTFSEALAHPGKGYICGTPGYMAPEQYRAENPDERTDIYALGALLYTLLCERCTISDSSVEVAARASSEGSFSAPSQIEPSVPLGIEAICLKALKPLAGERYAAVSELLTDVQKFRNGFASSAEAPGFLRQFALFWKRNRPVCRLISLFCLSAAVGVLLFIRQVRQSEEQLRVESRQLKEALTKYEKEKKHRYELGGIARDELLKKAHRISYEFDIDRNIKALDEAILYSPEYAELQMDRMKMSLIKQDFGDALKRIEALEKMSSNDNSDLKALCLKYSGTRSFDADACLGAMTVLRKRGWLLQAFIVEALKGIPGARHAEILQRYFQMKHPGTTAGIRVKPEGYSLSLNGGRLNGLRMLIALPLEELTLINCAPRLDYVVGPGLKALDLRASSISRIGGLKAPLLRVLKMKKCTDPENLLKLKMLTEVSVTGGLPAAVVRELEKRSVEIR